MERIGRVEGQERERGCEGGREQTRAQRTADSGRTRAIVSCARAIGSLASGLAMSEYVQRRTCLPRLSRPWHLVRLLAVVHARRKGNGELVRDGHRSGSRGRGSSSVKRRRGQAGSGTASNRVWHFHMMACRSSKEYPASMIRSYTAKSAKLVQMSITTLRK